MESAINGADTAGRFSVLSIFSPAVYHGAAETDRRHNLIFVPKSFQRHPTEVPSIKRGFRGVLFPIQISLHFLNPAVKSDDTPRPVRRLAINVNLRIVQYFINILFTNGCFVFQIVINNSFLFRQQYKQI